ncbi:MAG: acyl-CoA thioesterase [Proteobacteria bacterium]|nr:acyl-CoA thioesterase [Pseudomonadota bacterium]MBU1740947.1 acyl-CoA thioesterase [Pseudomonadota bacterium]
MEAKRCADSSLVTAIQMMPQDANPLGNVHGGVIMKYIDNVAGMVGTRHSGRVVVTASIDRLDFHFPVHVGNMLILKASANFVGRTSMEIGVRIEAENLTTGDVRHTASAYLTFVALDHTGRPTELPRLIVETEDEKRRHEEARRRREMRLAERAREKKEQNQA